MAELTYHTLLQALRNHIGRERGVTARALAAEILDSYRVDGANERRLRNLVVELRMQGHHVCAHPSSGYYLAETPEELEETCAFLRARALQSLSQISRMRGVSIPDLVGQMHLPT